MFGIIDLSKFAPMPIYEWIEETPNQERKGVPYKCPVCNGFGMRNEDEYLHTGTAIGKIVCSACQGTGIVWSGI